MRMRFMRCILTSLVMLLMLVITTVPAAATSRQQSNVDPSPLVASPYYKTTHFTVSRSVITSGVTGTHFLYVENGTCTDSIDVYQIGTTLTHVGNYPNDGCPPTPYFGRQSIAVTKANATHGPCLVYIDGKGFVDSFPINTDGSLGTEVSHVADATAPGDVHVSKNGNLVYVSSPKVDLESYSLGAGCALTTLFKVPVTSFYISFALVGSTPLVAANTNGTTIDTWALTSNGGMTLLTSVPGQISSPDSIAVQTAHTSSGTVTNVFTGQAIYGVPQAQGSQYSKTSGSLLYLSGSPATDPSAKNGAAVTFDNTDSLLIQGEQVTGTLGFYSVSAGIPGTPGSMTFLGETPLAVAGGQASAFAQLGSTLFVDPVKNGDVEACQLSSTGVSGCASVAVLTSTTGRSNGMVIL